MKLGVIAAIPLSNGWFGYGREYRDALGILEITSLEVLPLKLVVGHPVAFFVSYCEPVDYPEWIYVGKWKFGAEEDVWGPPQSIRDVLDQNVYRIYDRGKMRSATKAETAGLAPQILLSPEHVRERIEACFGRKTGPKEPTS